MVNRARVRSLNQARPGPGPVIYWMSRDQRVRDNWALLYAQELALSLGQPLGVVFCLAPAFLGATRRQYGFMLKGLQEVAGDLADLNLPFFLLHGGAGPGTARLCVPRADRGRSEQFFAVAPGAGMENHGGFGDRGFPGGSGCPQCRAVLAGLPQGGIRRLYLEAEAEKALAGVSGRFSTTFTKHPVEWAGRGDRKSPGRICPPPWPWTPLCRK